MSHEEEKYCCIKEILRDSYPFHFIGPSQNETIKKKKNKPKTKQNKTMKTKWNQCSGPHWYIENGRKRFSQLQTQMTVSHHWGNHTSGFDYH